MRKISTLALACTAVAGLGFGTGHAVTIRTAPNQDTMGSFYFGEAIPGGGRYGQIMLDNSIGAVTNGDYVSPNTNFTASGFLVTCTPTCLYVTFYPQTVSPTAFSLDALSENATMNACLVPSVGGACVPWNVTLSEPGEPHVYLQPLTFPCLYSGYICTGINAWLDQNNDSAEVTADELAVLVRVGYAYTGSVNGLALNPAGSTYNGTFRGIEATAVAHLP